MPSLPRTHLRRPPQGRPPCQGPRRAAPARAARPRRRAWPTSALTRWPDPGPGSTPGPAPPSPAIPLARDTPRLKSTANPTCCLSHTLLPRPLASLPVRRTPPPRRAGGRPAVPAREAPTAPGPNFVRAPARAEALAGAPARATGRRPMEWPPSRSSARPHKPRPTTNGAPAAAPPRGARPAAFSDPMRAFPPPHAFPTPASPGDPPCQPVTNGPGPAPSTAPLVRHALRPRGRLD